MHCIRCLGSGFVKGIDSFSPQGRPFFDANLTDEKVSKIAKSALAIMAAGIVHAVPYVFLGVVIAAAIGGMSHGIFLCMGIGVVVGFVIPFAYACYKAAEFALEMLRNYSGYTDEKFEKNRFYTALNIAFTGPLGAECLGRFRLLPFKNS